MTKHAGQRTIPWSLIVFRASLGPALSIVALRMRQPQLWLGAMILTGSLSDFFDGLLAGRWGTETASLRISDSVADTIFYMGVLAAIVLRHWPMLRERLWLVAVLLGLEAARVTFDWMKYRRMASYHSYAAKLWGLLLAPATIFVLCFDSGFWMLTVALVWGILCDLEGLAMSILLPVWTHDVRTIKRAIELRREMRAVLVP